MHWICPKFGGFKTFYFLPKFIVARISILLNILTCPHNMYHTNEASHTAPFHEQILLLLCLCFQVSICCYPQTQQGKHRILHFKREYFSYGGLLNRMTDENNFLIQSTISSKYRFLPHRKNEQQLPDLRYLPLTCISGKVKI